MNIIPANNSDIDFTKVNFSELSEMDASFIKDKLRDRDMTEMRKRIADMNVKYDKRLSICKDELEGLKTKTDGIADSINVIGFGIHSKKGKILRKICSSRIHSILGEMSGYNYLLWNPYFFKRIYNDLGNYFDVDSYKNIHVNDFEKAKAFASSWNPDDTYVYEKTQEMIEKRNKGLLSQTRCMALYAYLEETENGAYNPF